VHELSIIDHVPFCPGAVTLGLDHNSTHLGADAGTGAPCIIASYSLISHDWRLVMGGITIKAVTVRPESAAIDNARATVAAMIEAVNINMADCQFNSRAPPCPGSSSSGENG
jgi:hypothetical protein